MGANSNIEWTDATWNPIGGCSIASPGCTNCYAQGLAGTRLKDHPLYKGTTTESKAGPVFNGHLTAAPHDHPVWTWPMRWRGSKTPRRGSGARSLIFVGDMSDLFHEDRPDEVIDRVFAVMALCPQHDFQILTKRAARMRDYLNHIVAEFHGSPDQLNERFGEHCVALTGDPCSAGWFVDHVDWPLEQCWLGVSAERQKEADERIPHLLATPAAVRFVSAEPLIGPIDLRPPTIRSLDWIIAGGESGKDARPMHPDWARSIRDQCQAAGVAFHFKQWGEWAPVTLLLDEDGDGAAYPLPACSDPRHHAGDQECLFWQGDTLVHWPSVEATPAVGVRRLGKHRAGRLLDGREWSEFPEIANAD